MNRTSLRTSLRISTVLFAIGGLSACAAIQESQIFQPDTWSMGTTASTNTNNQAELGLGELAKGDNFKAQGHFEKALAANPADVHAMYGLAVLYQNTGQSNRARQLYEQILALNPMPTEEILIWAGKEAHPVIDVAEVNLQLLGGGAMAPLPGEQVQGSGQVRNAAAPSQLHVQPSFPSPMAQPQAVAQAEPMFKTEDLNIVARFKTMRALLDQGLITQDEFLVRRQVNAGALLPMSSAPAATGLDRAVPGVDQISGRLRAIGRALEMRALSPAQHTSERTMILDALMPAKPASVANPAPPPKGLMEAADAVRRLEMLKEVDLITSDEYIKERAAIEGSMQPAPSAPVSGLSGGGAAKSSAAASQSSLSGFQPAVHLASYRQKKAAQRGWVQLQKQFGSVLSGLTPSIERVDLGGGKGVFYRLKAGPLPSNGAAKDACRKLKAKRQYCDPSTINFG